MSNVILVDEGDNEIGYMEKIEAHQRGKLHRAFSVFIFNSRGEMLIQKRSRGKYHSGGLWTNACCSHPMPGEPVVSAAKRRLFEELGIVLQPVYSHKFIYKAEMENNLIEHELDHVFTGKFDGIPQVDTLEVEDWKFISMDALLLDVGSFPENYSKWFRMILADSRFEL